MREFAEQWTVSQTRIETPQSRRQDSTRSSLGARSTSSGRRSTPSPEWCGLPCPMVTWTFSTSVGVITQACRSTRPAARGWLAAIHPEDLPGLERHWRAVIASGKAGETEARLRRSDGVYRCFLFRGVPHYDSSGSLTRWYGETTDIDDLKRTEARLRHSEAFLTQAQRLSLTGSFGWNVATGELVWSPETFCILGYDRSTKPAMDLVLRRVHPDDREFVQQTLNRVQHDLTDLDFERRLIVPDGSIRHVHVLARATKTPTGTIEFVGAVMDVTQRARAAEALRASEHLARGQLEALTNALAVLSRESKPENFLEHVLRVICAQLGAHSIGAWEVNDTTDTWN